MRFKSEWLTLATATVLAAGFFFVPRHGSVPGAKPDDIAAAGVDYMPVGSAKNTPKPKVPHRKP